jgi:hypothetical protein
MNFREHAHSFERLANRSLILAAALPSKYIILFDDNTPVRDGVFFFCTTVQIPM